MQRKDSMANMDTSPSLTAKLKTKNTINRMKHGSPKLQEVLRQRCRQRMREKRSQLFDRQRHGLTKTDEEVHDALTEIVRTELSQLATMDIDTKNLFLIENYDVAMTQEEAFAVEKDILAEEEQWILLEYERLQRDEAEMLALFADECNREIVICPLCEKGSIAEREDALTCSLCDLFLPPKISFEDFARILRDRISSHSSVCSERPSFMVLPENHSTCLYLTCEKCATFALII